tara:strand:- start:580 stop:834 length:255 start_codon:yes stop_codon:yes gene_type:complete
MLRCLECNTTIKKADNYHQQEQIIHITGLERDWMDHRDNLGSWCCECLDHEIGQCYRDLARAEFGKQLIHAIARSTGVYRQGTL